MFLVFSIILSVSSVCASEDVDQALINENVETVNIESDLSIADANEYAIEDVNQPSDSENANSLAVESDLSTDNPIGMKDEEKLASGNTWYVNSSVSESGDGKSPETAFKTLNDAVTNSSGGDTILVAPGNYTGTGNKGFIIGKNNLTIMKYGDGEAIFDAERTHRILYVTAHTINIHGLTFMNGYDSQNGGAIYFDNSLVNSIINASFINNNAGDEGGAIYFRYDLINDTLIGDFTGNSAQNAGGANRFIGFLKNVNIIGNFTNNRLNYLNDGGANSFLGTLINVNITGNFKYNSAPYGAANYFGANVVNLTCVGNFTSNRGGSAGANYFVGNVTNALFKCNFTDNTAYGSLMGGGANFFYGIASNVTFVGNFINNRADNYHGSVNWFYAPADNIVMSGNFIGNTGNDVIYFSNPATRFVVRDSVIFNNAKFVNGGTIDCINTWFGNNATYYQIRPSGASLNNVSISDWLFLDASYEWDEYSQTVDVIFKFLSYNQGNISQYDNNRLQPISLTLSCTNGNIDKAMACFNETVKFVPNSVGISTVTASFENVQYTIAFEISKTDLNLIVDHMAINYGGNIVIPLNYPNTATGKINITLTGNNYNKTFENLDLNPIITLPETLMVGNYNVTVSYSGDALFNNVIAKGTFTVNPCPTQLITMDITSTYNETRYLQVTLKDIYGNPLGGVDITVDLDGAKVYTTDENGTVKVSISNLAAKIYTVNITYDGGESYTKSNAIATVTINKASTQLNASDVTAIYHANEYLIITLRNSQGNPLGGVDVTVDLNGSKVYTTDENGMVKVSTMDLAANNYTANISFEGNENYTESSAVATVIIEKDIPVIGVNGSSAGQYGPAVVDITVTDSQGNAVIGSVLINVDFKDYYLFKVVELDTEGKGQAIFKNIDPGSYDVNVTFMGNENYTSIFGQTTINVNEIVAIGTSVSIIATNISYGEENVINFTLTDENGMGLTGILDVFVGEKKYNVSVTDGVGSLDISDISVLNPGDHVVIANYAGNNNYLASFATSSFNVAKLTTIIEFNDMYTKTVDMNVDGRIGEYFNVVLKDEKGKALAGKTIQIGFNGKVYTRTTNETGGASLQINLARADIYTFAIAFLGDENYNGSFAVAKITTTAQTPQLLVQNKSYKASVKTKALTATFKTAAGTVLAGKKISFTVNGKTYTATTNSKGVATVNVSITAKGSYKVTAKFAGDSTYAAITKTGTLKLT